MAKQAIENRIERLENGMGAGDGRVALVFDDNPPRQWPDGTTVIHVSFVEPKQAVEVEPC